MRRLTISLFLACSAATAMAQQKQADPCDPGNGGLTLPDGFCAKVIADVAAPARHVAVAPNSRVFASGFAGRDVVKGPNDAVYRPVGITQAPDGSLVVTDDSKGRVWRISYTGRR